MTPEQAAGWLAGFIDGEGCVYWTNRIWKGKRAQSRVLTITNTDQVLMDRAAEYLTMLGIEYRRHDRPGATEGRKHCYTIDIRKGGALARVR